MQNLFGAAQRERCMSVNIPHDVLMHLISKLIEKSKKSVASKSFCETNFPRLLIHSSLIELAEHNVTIK